MAPPPPWLPEDVISEILSRTPVKSVCRFRCVSSGWRALISDPAFAAAHRCPDLVLVTSCRHEHTGKSEIRVMDMDGNVLRAMMDFAGTNCSLLAAIDCSLYVDASSGQVVNVATGQVLVACPPELSKIIDDLFTIGRAAAPSSAYKAVHATYSRPHTCMVLTLGEEDAEWRVAPPPPYGASIRYAYGSVVTLNGVVYFLPGIGTPPHPKEVDDGDGVLRFDLESETWKETIEGPPIAKPHDVRTRMTTRITNLNDALCMVVVESHVQSPTVHDGGGGDDRPRTDVWLLADPGGSSSGVANSTWTKAYSIPMDPHVYSITPLRMMTRDVDDGRQKQLLFFCYAGGSNNMKTALRIYDPPGGGAAAGETCTESATKLPRNHLSLIGLCALHLKHVVVPRCQPLDHPPCLTPGRTDLKPTSHLIISVTKSLLARWMRNLANTVRRFAPPWLLAGPL